MNKKQYEPCICVVRFGSQYFPTDEELEEVRRSLKEEWKKIWNGNPPVPLFVLPPGMDCYFA